MGKENYQEGLFRKFVANRCTPEEIEQVLHYLNSADTAKSFIQSLISEELQQEGGSNHAMDPRRSEEIRQRILERIKSNTAPDDTQVRPPAFIRPRRSGAAFYWRAAAVFAGLLMLAGAGYRLFFYDPLTTHSTFYGQMATIVLPDSSTVILNGNSKISYRPEWGQGIREVWIEGEAFFSVKHTHDDRKFIVHSSEELDVEVLGTEFNVYDRPDAIRVVLNSGKVKLNIRENEGATQRVDMLPGELVELHEDSKYEKRLVNPELFTSWVNGKVVLENTSFRDIVVLLEETYGLSVSVPDTALFSERFSGTVSSENVEALLKALALSFNLHIKTKGDHVIFNVK